MSTNPILWILTFNIYFFRDVAINNYLNPIILVILHSIEHLILSAFKPKYPWVSVVSPVPIAFQCCFDVVKLYWKFIPNMRLIRNVLLLIFLIL